MPMSFRKAVDAMCKRCSHDPLDTGTWRQQVERCLDETCPLHPLRPRSMPRSARPESSPEGVKIDARGEG